MRKLLAILLVSVLVISLAACGGNTDGSTAGTEHPDTVQNEDHGEADTPAETETAAQTEEVVPTEGTPLNWPDNDYTKLVPTPNCGGKVLTSGAIGNLFSVEVKWTMEQGLVYAQQLADAGFGDDCAEIYEKHGYIDRTANGINVQLLDLFGMASVSIMPVEE